MAAPVIASVGTTTFNTATPGVPSGVASGSLIVMLCAAEYGPGPSVAPGSNPFSATGFTAGPFFADISDGTVTEIVGILYKYATAADTGTYTAAANGYSSQSSGDHQYIAARITGGATSGNPFNTADQKSGHANPGPVTITTYTPQYPSGLLLANYWDFDNAFASTIPSGWTKNAGGTTALPLTMASIAQSGGPAATGSLAFNDTNGDGGQVIIVALYQPTVALLPILNMAVQR